MSNLDSKIISLRIPRDVADALEAKRLPGQPFTYVIVSTLRAGLSVDATRLKGTK